jgi:hypothetical protein
MALPRRRRDLDRLEAGRTRGECRPDHAPRRGGDGQARNRLGATAGSGDRACSRRWTALALGAAPYAGRDRSSAAAARSGLSATVEGEDGPLAPLDRAGRGRPTRRCPRSHASRQRSRTIRIRRRLSPTARRTARTRRPAMSRPATMSRSQCDSGRFGAFARIGPGDCRGRRTSPRRTVRRLQGRMSSGVQVRESAAASAGRIEEIDRRALARSGPDAARRNAWRPAASVAARCVTSSGCRTRGGEAAADHTSGERVRVGPLGARQTAARMVVGAVLGQEADMGGEGVGDGAWALSDVP